MLKDGRGLTIDTQSVTLAPNEFTTVEFTVKDVVSGKTYEFVVGSLEDEITVSSKKEEPIEPTEREPSPFDGMWLFVLTVVIAAITLIYIAYQNGYLSSS